MNSTIINNKPFPPKLTWNRISKLKEREELEKEARRIKKSKKYK